MDMIEEGKVRRRRRYDDKFKQQVVNECAEPGASVAAVALAHGINTNLVHTWRREVRQGSEPPTFIPVALAPPSPAPVAALRE